MSAIYGWPPQPPRQPRLAGVRHQLIIGGAFATAAFLLGLLGSPRGWLAVGLAWALWGLFAGYRGRERFRVLVTGTVAALLAWAVVTATPAPPVKHKPPARAEQTVDLDQLRGTVADQWERLASGFSKYAPLSKGGR